MISTYIQTMRKREGKISKFDNLYKKIVLLNIIIWWVFLLYKINKKYWDLYTDFPKYSDKLKPIDMDGSVYDKLCWI